MDTSSAERIRNTLPLLNERQCRLYLANEARAMGRGRISQVSRVSGVSRVTIAQGLKEINKEGYRATEAKRSRREGGPQARDGEDAGDTGKARRAAGAARERDPENPLKWSGKSLRALETALTGAGRPVSDATIARLLRARGYSLQSNRKELAPPGHSRP
jgi:DNA-binding MurR/RpiR family transcriptional regulator